jgi:hypothetical protein
MEVNSFVAVQVLVPIINTTKVEAELSKSTRKIDRQEDNFSLFQDSSLTSMKNNRISRVVSLE